MKKRMIMLLCCLISTVTIAQEIKFGKIKKEELQEQMYAQDSLAKAAFTFKQKKIYYEYDGSQGWEIITEVHERIKIYSKDGADFAQKRIRLFERGGKSERVTGLKAYTYNLEGNKIQKEKLSKKQVFKEKLSNNWNVQKFTMPNIKAGSVVEWVYKIRSPYYSVIDEINLQEVIPIKTLDVVVRIPEYFVFKVNYKGYLQSYFTNSYKNRRISYSYRTNGDPTKAGGVTTRYDEKVDLKENLFILKKESVPALITSEKYVSNLNNYRRAAKFEMTMTKFPNSAPRYNATSWEDVSKRIFKSSGFGGEIAKTNYYKNDLAQVLANSNSEIEKTFGIYNFVKSKMKWNQGYGIFVSDGVRKAYKNGLGNVAEINLMLTSMLRSAGLNANPVLISTRSHGVPMFPTIDGFNYVISSVVFKDGSYALLDATEPYSLPNLLPPRTINWNGRMVKSDGTSVSIDLVPKKHSSEDNMISIKISDDVVTGLMRTKLTNYKAYAFRVNNNHVKDESTQAKLEEKYNIEIDNFRITNKTSSKPISRMIKFSSEDLIESIGGKLYIQPLLFLTETSNPFKSEKRNFPVDFVTPWQEKNTISIDIPAGYKVESVPETMAISMAENYGTFKFQVLQSPKKIKILAIAQINKAVFTPEFYPELKEFYNRMVKKQSEKIVLVKE